MAYADYNSEEQALVVRFNDWVREHLLQLNDGNFTQAQLMQLLKLKRAHSYRIYWLLKQYGSFGTRTIRVDELKRCDLLPFTGPVESRVSGILKLDGSGGSYYLIGR